MENSMLFILDIIISFTQITGKGGPGVPCCGLKEKGVDTQTDTRQRHDDHALTQNLEEEQYRFCIQEK